MPTRARKEEYLAKLSKLLDEYKSILIVNGDNVGSKQFADIRADLRKTENKAARAEVLFGKNTLMRRCISLHENEKVKALLPYIKLNMGFVFTNGDLGAVRDIIGTHVKGAPAKAGVISDKIINIPAGPTGQPPDKTAFFQALQIPTKINRGQIEITSDYDIIHPGDKIGVSQVALLQMLDIRPFTYGLKINHIYSDGDVFAAAVLDISASLICDRFLAGVNNVAAMSLALEVPTMAAVPHLIVKGFQDLVSIALASPNYTFAEADLVQDMLDNPDKYGGGGGTGTGTGTGTGAAEPEPEPEEEPEEEVDMSGGDMFGGDDY